MKNKEYYKKYEDRLGLWRFGDFIRTENSEYVYELILNSAHEERKSSIKAVSIPESEEEIKILQVEGLDHEGILAYLESVVDKYREEFSMIRKLEFCENIVKFFSQDVIKAGDGWDILTKQELVTPIKALYNVRIGFPDVKTVLQIGLSISTALESCESIGISHNNVNLDSIYRDSQGVFKLGNFALAKYVSRMSKSFVSDRSTMFIAPETELMSKAGIQADIFSLGMVMYSLLNDGRLPYEPSISDSPSLLQSAIDSAYRARLSSKDYYPAPTKCSPQVSGIIITACHPVVSKRYRNASEMKKAIEAVFYREFASERELMIWQDKERKRQEEGQRRKKVEEEQKRLSEQKAKEQKEMDDYRKKIQEQTRIQLLTNNCNDDDGNSIGPKVKAEELESEKGGGILGKGFVPPNKIEEGMPPGPGDTVIIILVAFVIIALLVLFYVLIKYGW